MEEQSCVLLENSRRISAFASQLPFMRGTALPPDPGIKNRQAPCGACRFLVRAAGLEPARRMAMEPKSIESTNSTTPAYAGYCSTKPAAAQGVILGLPGRGRTGLQRRMGRMYLKYCPGTK